MLTNFEEIKEAVYKALVDYESGDVVAYMDFQSVAEQATKRIHMIEKRKEKGPLKRCPFCGEFPGIIVEDEETHYFCVASGEDCPIYRRPFSLEEWNTRFNTEEEEEDSGLGNCPFCGSHMLTVKQGETDIHIWYYVYCKNCFAQGPQYGNRDKAVDVWKSK